MELSYIFLQHYWWLIISVLAGALVFLMFVQGGQTFLMSVAKTPEEKSLLAHHLGHKWELTFTTLVTFGGAFFASFPLFYSTSFGGAIYVWMLILFAFVVQAVAYEYRSKPNNFLGTKTYDTFLFLNGVLATILIGTAVGTFFTGAEFSVDRANIGIIGDSNAISQWHNPLRGVEAVFDYRNVALGLAVFFLARVLAVEFFLNQIGQNPFIEKLKKPLLTSTVLFLVTFLTFLISILFSKGWEQDSAGVISVVDFKYLNNLLDMPIVALLLVVGVVAVLWSLYLAILKSSPKAIWFGGAGTMVTVIALFLLAGWNGTAYYPSAIDTQSSLTITNSSSSHFTLKTMFYASLFIPVVVFNIWNVWKKMSKPGSKESIY